MFALLQHPEAISGFQIAFTYEKKLSELYLVEGLK